MTAEGAFDECVEKHVESFLWRECIQDMWMNMHEAFHGVPCGPVLTMVHPVELTGLRDIISP